MINRILTSKILFNRWRFHSNFSSEEYVEGARQYLNSSIATNLRIRNALGDLKSEFITANGDSVGDSWPYSKRLEAVEKLAAKQFEKKNCVTNNSHE